MRVVFVHKHIIHYIQMPPKRRVPPGGAKRPPQVKLDPEAEEQLKKEIEFCLYHFEGLF